MVIAAAFAVGAALFASAMPEMRQVTRQTPWDLKIDYLMARAYWQGYSPYTDEGLRRSGLDRAGPTGLGHPPTTSFWILPLTPLSVRTAGRVLGAFVFLLLFIQVAAGLRLFSLPVSVGTAWSTAAWLATAGVIVAYLANCSFMTYHVGVGQISGLIAFCYFAAWWAARKGRDLVAGAALGAACTLKLFPGVMLIFLLLGRRFRSLAAAGLVYLAVAAVMTARFGVASWGRFLSAQSQVADRWIADIQNQSIHGIVSRVFEPVCVRHGPVLPWAIRISAALSLLLLASAAWWTRRIRQPRPGREGTDLGFDISFALFVVLSVVMSQWAWEHYTIIYVLPALIVTGWLRNEWRSGRRPGQVAFMAAALLGIAATWRIDVHVKQDLQRAVHGGRWQEHLSLHAFDVLNWLPGLVLLALLFVAVRRIDVSQEGMPGAVSESLQRSGGTPASARKPFGYSTPPERASSFQHETPTRRGPPSQLSNASASRRST